MKKVIAMIFLCCASIVHAQTLEQKPILEVVTRTAKDSRPVPGIFCGQERTIAMFDEYSFMAVDQSLVTEENVRRCLRTLPKHFTRTAEHILSFMAEDLRGDEVAGLGCSFVKPVGKSPQWKISFAIPYLLKQRQIDTCFEKALNGPNRLRVAPVNDT